MEGMPCDDKDPQRLCLQGKCSKSVCADKVQGQYCDRRLVGVCGLISDQIDTWIKSVIKSALG